MTKICAFCIKQLVWPQIFTCYYCQNTYCDQHRLAENHQCPKVVAARHIEKDWLRKKGVNITTAKYSTVCKQCGYSSPFAEIEEANQLRIDHIKSEGCPSNLVQLRQHDEDRKADEQLVQNEAMANAQASEWMYDCLKSSKDIIKKFHLYCDCDTEGFFRTTTYDLYIQNDNQSAYAYINMMSGSSHFPIGVHPVFTNRTRYNERALVVVLVHELLHALHPKWGHDRINPQERLLANKAAYFDALVELERIAVTGKMRFCLQ